MKQIWHHFSKWEEIPAGMWRETTTAERAEMLTRAAEFTGDAAAYGKAMMRVVREWPVSCEQNLTDVGQNRKAWIGHAAACLEMGFPEYVTRQAWGLLSQTQQDEANAMASNAIREWESVNEVKNKPVHKEVGTQMLFGWHTRLRASAA
jgi:hypothetical protein